MPLGKGRQPMAHYLLDHYTSDRNAFTQRDREIFAAPFRDSARAAAILDGHQEYADDLTLEEVDGASHFIADEKPQVVIDRALEFFG
jgi:pimeloyl-ACP methyl ester carboxylesterase